jgi:hypothetical protein
VAPSYFDVFWKQIGALVWEDGWAARNGPTIDVEWVLGLWASIGNRRIGTRGPEGAKLASKPPPFEELHSSGCNMIDGTI